MTTCEQKEPINALNFNSLFEMASLLRVVARRSVSVGAVNPLAMSSRHYSLIEDREKVFAPEQSLSVALSVVDFCVATSRARRRTRTPLCASTTPSCSPSWRTICPRRCRASLSLAPVSWAPVRRARDDVVLANLRNSTSVVAGIAQVTAQAGLEVTLVDLNQSVLDGGLKRIQDSVARVAKKQHPVQARRLV